MFVNHRRGRGSRHEARAAEAEAQMAMAAAAHLRSVVPAIPQHREQGGEWRSRSAFDSYRHLPSESLLVPIRMKQIAVMAGPPMA